MESKTYEELDLCNAIIIGFMMGIYNVLGKGGTQAIANMAGEHVGREILRFAKERGVGIKSLADFARFATEYHLAEEIEFTEAEGVIKARIKGCLICPKKVGHYDFEGTACPWGGVLTGVLNHITGKRFSSASRLTPGEECEIEIRKG